MRYIQVAWTSSVIYKQYKFVLKIQGFLRGKTKLNSVALVRTRTIPTERPPPVGEVSANFCG